MRLRRFTWLFGAVALCVAAPHSLAQEFFLKKGDVVVVMGDSITEQRLYSNYLELWSQTRFPSYNLVFRNVGIGGDTSTGGNGRFKRDVLTHKPTVLTVDFGMNDGGYIWPGKIVNKKEITQADIDARYATYMKGLQGIASQAKAAKIRVAWITPQPREDGPGAENEKYNPTLEKFSAGVKEIATKNEGQFADQFHPYWAVIHKAREAGAKGRITAGDAVHPGPPGQALMAASILKGLNFPKQVSSVAVKVQGKENEVIKATNCKISEIKSKIDGVSFMREDSALPFFPLDNLNPNTPKANQPSAILKYTPLLEDMNEYQLVVRGLKKGNYEVRLGGKKVAECTDKELALGVNLAAAALTAGPVADQVKDVVKAVTDKTNYYHGQIYSPLVLGRNVNAKNPDFKDVAKEDYQKKREALIAERMQKMPEYDAAIRKALEPRTHLVEIMPVK
jgi:lysophospholipase L1-like esterase